MINRINSQVETITAHNYHEKVVCVGISTIVISAAMFVGASVSLVTLSPKESLEYKRSPILAINLIFALVAASLSFYQILISLLLLYQSCKVANIFLCNLWYLSHITILIIYLILFGVKTATCVLYQQYVFAILTFVGGVVYEVVFICFLRFVYIFKEGLDVDRYF